ncbi:MAG: hypothetical protein HY000_18720 [Planctomycetes bacterium]|nr:hypothetical protein [Planctomycetota bacterium]
MIRNYCLPLFCLLAVNPVWADEPAKSGDESDKSKSSAATQEPAKPKLPPSDAAGDAELLRALEKRAAPEVADDEAPLIRVGRRMRNVQGRLDQSDAGDETRVIQKEIVLDLDKLIEELKKGGG